MADSNNPTTHSDSKSRGEGCSPYFASCSAMSFISGIVNRKTALKRAHQDEQFAKELSHQKELYEDGKEEEEYAFKIWLKNSQRKFKREMAAIKLSDDLALEDLKMFFSAWPLKITVEALIKKQQDETQAKPMCFVVGKATAGRARDAFSLSYSEIVDKVATLLKDAGMGGIGDRVYRFKEEPIIVGGPALANIYAMMNTFPTVVILPSINQKYKKISLSVGCWTPDSLFPFQKKVLSMDYDPLRIANEKKSLEDFKERYSYVCFTIAAVLNDTYNLSEGDYSCLFPRFASKHPQLKQYPEIAKFAIQEYASFIDTRNNVIDENGNIINVWNETVGEEERKKIECLISESINLIKDK